MNRTIIFTLLFFCVAEFSNVHAQKIYYTQDGVNKIGHANLDGSEPTALIESRLEIPDAIVLDSAKGKLIWVDAEQRMIHRANLDGSESETLFTLQRFAYRAYLALDQERRKIYWITTVPLASGNYESSLRSSSLDDLQLETLLSFQDGSVYSVTTDPVTGDVYWAQRHGEESESTIWRSSGNSFSPEFLFPATSYVSNLEIDAALGKIYWTDLFSNTIHRADMDGSNLETIVSLGTVEPIFDFELDLIHGKIYWAISMEWDRDILPKIRRSNLDGTNIEDFLAVGPYPFSPRGLEIDAENGFLYWTANTWFYLANPMGKIQRANLDGSNITSVLQSEINAAHCLALDFESNKIYWIDHGTYSLRRANLDGSQIETLISQTVPTPPNSPFPPLPSAIALDLSGGKMYWGTRDNNTSTPAIQRANLDGSQYEALVHTVQAQVSGLEQIYSLALDLEHGKMYWSQDRYEPALGKVKRSNLDGSQIETLFYATTASIALDHIAGKIYWSKKLDSGGSIHRANLDGSNPEIVVSQNVGTPLHIALDLHRSQIFWTDISYTTPSIRVASLSPGSVGSMVLELNDNAQGTAMFGIALDAAPRIIASIPSNQSIDARQPHLLQDSSQLFGWDAIHLQFNQEIFAFENPQFQITEIGGDGVPPQIISIENHDFDSLFIQLDAPLQPGARTVVEYPVSNMKICLGYLPGDVNNDGQTSPVDILFLINFLNGISPYSNYAEFQTDMDHSGASNPGDILRLIDLLNGAQAFESWNGSFLPNCP